MIIPYLSIASIEYSEQVGVNLQLGGSRGDMKYLYSFINDIRIFFMNKPR